MNTISKTDPGGASTMLFLPLHAEIRRQKSNRQDQAHSQESGHFPNDRVWGDAAFVVLRVG